MPSRPPSDLTKDGATLIASLLNMKEKAGTRLLTAADISVGVPSATPDGSLKNSQVDVTATADCPYQGTITITYDRLDLAAVIGHYDGTAPTDAAPWQIGISPGDITSIAQVVAQLNDPLNDYFFTILPEDYVDGAVDSSVLPVTANVVMQSSSTRFINYIPVQLVQGGGAV